MNTGKHYQFLTLNPKENSNSEGSKTDSFKKTFMDSNSTNYSIEKLKILLMYVGAYISVLDKKKTNITMT